MRKALHSRFQKPLRLASLSLSLSFFFAHHISSSFPSRKLLHKLFSFKLRDLPAQNHTHTHHTSQCLLPTPTTPPPPPTAPLRRCPSGANQGSSPSKAPHSVKMVSCLAAGPDKGARVQASSTRPTSVAMEILSALLLTVCPEEKPPVGHQP